jgi:hypothetical protein
MSRALPNPPAGFDDLSRRAMNASATAVSGEAMIWSRLLRAERDDLPPEAAQAFLKLELEPDDLARMRDLAAKNRSDTLTEGEELELEAYCRVGRLLDLMHSKARRALKKPEARR